jgi:hypothetical protein
MSKGTQTIEGKKVVTNKVTKSSEVLNAITKPTKVDKIKVVSNYKTNVVEANRKLNTEKNSLGAYLDLLKKYDFVLCKEFKQYIDAIKKDNNKFFYDELLKVVRTTKNGKFNQFYTLQGLQKVCFPKIVKK